MSENSTDARQRFLLMLREFRPELAEFMMLCARNGPASGDRTFIIKRVECLVSEGGALGFNVLMARADELKHALHHYNEDHELASLTKALLDAALVALTFSGDAPVSSSRSMEKKWRLVVADDDRIVCEMMSRLFSDEAELYTASNGKQAYALIQQHRPHLVILDDFMPEMTGLKMIELLHSTKELSGIAVMMLTGSDRERDRQRAMDAGAIGYMTKPFNPADLKRSVHEQLNKMNINTI